MNANREKFKSEAKAFWKLVEHAPAAVKAAATAAAPAVEAASGAFEAAASAL